MIQSMTGYGKEVIQLPSKTITIEIKSLNSKGLDLNTRVPIAYREKEMEIRDLLAKSLVRGKIDFSIYVETATGATTTQINTEVVKHYMEELAGIVDGNQIALLKIAMSMPDTLSTQVEEIDSEEYESILEGINTALTAITKFRTDEGHVLALDFNQRVETISKLLKEVKEVAKERIPEVRERLRKAVSELEEKVDENRFEQELIYYLEKYDITEETVRLKNHLDYFEKALTSEESNGKKLAFITQEIGREINTIGSKANQATMQQLVVQMKDELEKIKEQMLNVL